MMLNDPIPSVTSASDTTSSPIDSNAALRPLLIVIHSRELLRACLCYWLHTLGQEFEVISAPDAKKLISADTLSRACAVVIGANSSLWPDRWLQDQITFLRATQPIVPIVVICEEDIAEKYNGMKLQGFIPTSSTVEMA